MKAQYYCKNRKRRELVRDQDRLNGIDYLEVSQDQRRLEVHFIHPLSDQSSGRGSDQSSGRGSDQGSGQGSGEEGLDQRLTANNLAIEGGVRIPNVRVVSVDEPKGNVLTAEVNSPGDFSTYRLRLIKSPTNPVTPEGFDPKLSEIEFSFKVRCPNDFDCDRAEARSQERQKEPRIDYMAKDYASFRHLLLDRLSVMMPDWNERNPADLGVALVELLAYAGDYLSYYQDAVATEAYLDTARKRVSVRRHARLLDYMVHDGCNARVWVCFEVEGSEVQLTKGDKVLTRCVDETMILPDGWERRIAGHHPEIFELMHDAALHPQNNEINFYTWGDDLCCLPKGATRATLCDNDDPKRRLRLGAGDVLIFEEKLGATTGERADADPKSRHAVRLTAAKPGKDDLTGQAVLEIEWHPQDALPFPLCIASRIRGKVFSEMSRVRGNVVLADHGRTLKNRSLIPMAVPEDGQYRPRLKHEKLTFQTVYDRDRSEKTPASATIRQEPHRALPSIHLIGDGDRWSARRDLLNCCRFATEFVVETEDDGTPYLRFGDDLQGKRPSPGTVLKAFYRIGNGIAGNVGAGSIAHIIPTESRTSGTGQIIKVRNPMPAQGGTDPEPTSQVKLYAPHLFRRQQRAVTEEDYAEVAERHPEVERALATLRWTGSWHTMYITVDRKVGLPVDSVFEENLRRFLERFRLAGSDIEIEAPRFVPLTIAFTVCVKPGYTQSNVKQELLEAFSNHDLPDGRRGFFHPDNFTFEQPVYLSQIVDTAMDVPGVLWVDTRNRKPHLFRVLGHPNRGEIEEGMIGLGRLEIARLDNDPNAPENGKIEFFMEGGM